MVIIDEFIGIEMEKECNNFNIIGNELLFRKKYSKKWYYHTKKLPFEGYKVIEESFPPYLKGKKLLILEK